MRLRRPAHGRGDRRDQRRARDHARGTGRLGRPLARLARRRLGGGPVRRRGRARGGSPAQGRSGVGRARRGDPRQTPTSRPSRALRPAFTADGTVTAGNASQISDGACAVVVMSDRKAERARAGAARARSRRTGCRPTGSRRCRRCRRSRSSGRCKKAGRRRVRPRACVEINEAFAAVAIHSARMLGVDEEIVNVNGGAVALGHPIGASGARIVLTLALEMRRRGVGLGAAAICGGGGQGDALVLRRAADAQSSAPSSDRRCSSCHHDLLGGLVPGVRLALDHDVEVAVSSRRLARGLPSSSAVRPSPGAVGQEHPERRAALLDGSPPWPSRPAPRRTGGPPG